MASLSCRKITMWIVDDLKKNHRIFFFNVITVGSNSEAFQKASYKKSGQNGTHHIKITYSYIHFSNIYDNISSNSVSFELLQLNT